MKIVHICLACFYVEGMAYQENLLPKYHAKKHDVYVITSDYSFDSLGHTQTKAIKEYINNDGVKVKVLENAFFLGHKRKYNRFVGLYDTLCDINPDIIFCHGGQFVSLKDVIRYCKKNINVKLFIDQHGDYYNMPVNTFRRKLGQWLIYGRLMRKAAKYTDKFWGVTPWRCEYLKDVYGIPENKIGFLPMGGDDESINFKKKNLIRDSIRTELSILHDDFLIVTGGKIDEAKRIDVLMEVVSQLDKNIKLIVFGETSEHLKDKVLSLSKNNSIRYVGWIPSHLAYNYFLASDLAVFPGTHSVLWEQACSCGIPCVVKDWPGMHHVDLGGNALFLQGNTKDELKNTILHIYENKHLYESMKSVAVNKAISYFSYERISRQAILEE